MQALEIEIPISYDSKPAMRKVEVDEEDIDRVITRYREGGGVDEEFTREIAVNFCNAHFPTTKTSCIREFLPIITRSIKYISSPKYNNTQSSKYRSIEEEVEEEVSELMSQTLLDDDNIKVRHVALVGLTDFTITLILRYFGYSLPPTTSFTSSCIIDPSTCNIYPTPSNLPPSQPILIHLYTTSCPGTILTNLQSLLPPTHLSIHCGSPTHLISHALALHLSPHSNFKITNAVVDATLNDAMYDDEYTALSDLCHVAGRIYYRGCEYGHKRLAWRHFVVSRIENGVEGTVEGCVWKDH